MIILESWQKKALRRLWFVYGNYGKFHTDDNHKFIQSFLERGEDHRNFYAPSKECVEAVDKILNELADTGD